MFSILMTYLDDGIQVSCTSCRTDLVINLGTEMLSNFRAFVRQHRHRERRLPRQRLPE